eukprot:GHRQ01002902.1.p1 GENE.GHRQ01002902.1~~GHRQ01002902.1.p1  ORF type:complete len:138 (+),score=20.76 GHRQ01002902.1:299-712(+)
MLGVCSEWVWLVVLILVVAELWRDVTHPEGNRSALRQPAAGHLLYCMTAANCGAVHAESGLRLQLSWRAFFAVSSSAVCGWTSGWAGVVCVSCGVQVAEQPVQPSSRQALHAVSDRQLGLFMGYQPLQVAATSALCW